MSRINVGRSVAGCASSRAPSLPIGICPGHGPARARAPAPRRSRLRALSQQPPGPDGAVELRKPAGVLSRLSFDNGRVGSCGAGALARSPTPWSGLAWFRTKAGRGRPARSRGTAPQEWSRFGRDRTLARIRAAPAGSATRRRRTPGPRKITRVPSTTCRFRSPLAAHPSGISGKRGLFSSPKSRNPVTHRCPIRLHDASPPGPTKWKLPFISTT
jgi:hypothetical protein